MILNKKYLYEITYSLIGADGKPHNERKIKYSADNIKKASDYANQLELLSGNYLITKIDHLESIHVW